MFKAASLITTELRGKQQIKHTTVNALKELRWNGATENVLITE